MQDWANDVELPQYLLSLLEQVAAKFVPITHGKNRAQSIRVSVCASKLGNKHCRMSSKKNPSDEANTVSDSSEKNAAPEPEWAGGLRSLYDSVVEEELPDSFKDLLSKLDEEG